MTPWRRLGGARLLYAPIALRPIDDFTGAAPIEPLEVVLDRQDGVRWVETELEAVRTLSGVFSYPGLGRAQQPALSPVVRYRVRLMDADERFRYIPAYRHTVDGLEFDVAPWNDVHPPVVVPDRPETVFLWPGSNYPFSGAVPVLRGRTLDVAGAPLADARVATLTDRVLSDRRGAFSLPIRLTAALPSITVVAEHARSGVSTTASVALPADLTHGIDLQLT